MAARTKARKRALDLLFASEVRHRPAVEALEEERADTAPDARPVADYTATLVQGVEDHRSRIDELLRTYARDWSLERMPAVDRNLLRLAVFELLWVDETPDAVAVSEAVNLARELSTDESPAYVNGVLASVMRDKADIVA